MIKSEENFITLVCSDGKKFQVDRRIVERSELIMHTLENFTKTEIILEEIQGPILEKIIDYLKHYFDIKPKEIIRPLPCPNLELYIDEWDFKFINVDLDIVIEIANAANFMGIIPLSYLAGAKIATYMMGTTEEIRKNFGIECDLTPEELKEYEE
jgi:S-phase kinase-associated protein 1